MLINDYFFLIYFLPIFIALYFFVSKKNKLANILIIISSLIFYSTFSIFNLIFLIVPAIIDYIVGNIIFRSRNKGLRKLLLIVMIIFSLGLLGYFKYNVFVATTVQSLLNNSLVLSDFGKEV